MTEWKKTLPENWSTRNRVTAPEGKLIRCVVFVVLAFQVFPRIAGAQTEESTGEQGEVGLAQQLSNPVADLTSVPFQSNFEHDGGPNDDGFRYLMNFQPVIPISLNETWNVISRTIVPLIDQDDMIGTGSESGVGDILQSFFFSPKEPTENGWIWGAGPVFLLPTATDDLLGTEKYGFGPTAVVLKQERGWTYGVLANHIWSVAGDDQRQDVNSTFIQPFLGYTTGKQTTYTINSESTYDWENSQWTAPINLMVAQLVKIGGMPVQFQLGAKYYLDGPDNSPEWGWRFNITLFVSQRKRMSMSRHIVVPPPHGHQLRHCRVAYRT